MIAKIGIGISSHDTDDNDGDGDDDTGGGDADAADGVWCTFTVTAGGLVGDGGEYCGGRGAAVFISILLSAAAADVI